MPDTLTAPVRSRNRQPVTNETPRKPMPETRRREPQPTPIIAEDPRLLKLWQEANEDERFLGEALCRLNARMQSDGIESYFLFADLWYERYPKADAKYYKRGLNSVGKGSAIGSCKKSIVYAILKTIKIYSRAHYAELAAKAEPKGIVIGWSQLRMIAERLGKKEHRNIRREVEKQLVSRKLKVLELKRLIDDLAPETVAAAETVVAPKPARERMTTLIASFKRTSNRFQAWQEAITGYEDEIHGDDDPKETKKVREQVEKALQEFDRMISFIEENRPALEMLRRQVSEPAATEPDTEKIARAVTERVERERQSATDRQSAAERKPEPVGRPIPSGRLKLAGEFADDPTPRTVLRDGDEYRGKSFTRNDEAEGDENEFAGTDDEDDLEYEEEEGWEDLDEDDDPVFTETGDIPERRRY